MSIQENLTKLITNIVKIHGKGKCSQSILRYALNILRNACKTLLKLL